MPSAPLPSTPEIEAAKIWARAKHNAFTDLARYRGAWYCAFREGASHAGSEGRIRILRSPDAKSWSSGALLAQRGIDLRDPRLSLTPSGDLMLLAGGTKATNGRRPRVSFSSDGASWSPLEAVLEEGDWLWRLTWHGRRGYGITYRLESARRWTITLLATSDGLRYEEVCGLGVGGKPNEATVRFRPDGRAVALVRREGGDRQGWVGSSVPPYTDWRWSALPFRLGGPNFLVLPDGSMWASTRIIRHGEARTCVGPLTEGSFEPLFTLPGGGDCGYPGMVLHRAALWLSYYSSHEGKAAIYLARIRAIGGMRAHP